MYVFSCVILFGELTASCTKTKKRFYKVNKELQVSNFMTNYLDHLKNFVLNKNDGLQCDAANFRTLATKNRELITNIFEQKINTSSTFLSLFNEMIPTVRKQCYKRIEII